MRPLGILLLAGCAAANVDADRAAILSVLSAQAEAWNRGDLDRFLEGYWKSERTVFAGGSDVHRGFEAMAARYRKTYGSREKMGKLAFSALSFESIEADRAVITGAWELEITGQETRPGGVFTLIFRRVPEGWRIVHDHTSSR
jgi:ketosteroid isomerase-like protein